MQPRNDQKRHKGAGEDECCHLLSAANTKRTRNRDGDTADEERRQVQEQLHPGIRLGDVLIETGFRRQRRERWVQPGTDNNIENIGSSQHQPRGERRREKLSDRCLSDQAVYDQNNRGGDHRTQRPSGADGTDCEVFVVTQTQHLRQGDQAKQHDLAADDARHRRHDDRHHGGNNRNTATHASHRNIESAIHVLGDAGPFQK